MRTLGWFHVTVAFSFSFSIAATAGAADRSPPATLLEEDFAGYRPGIVSSVVGAHTEYQYLPEAAPKGKWAVSTFRSKVESQRAWRVVADESGPAMAQTYRNKETFWHPMIVTGDPLWRDYRATVRFIPEGSEGRAGVVVRYRNDRCYYFVGVDGPKAVLKLVRHEVAYHKPLEKVLAEADLDWRPGEELEAVVSVTGDEIKATLGGVALEARDATFAEGRVALTSDAPTVFRSAIVQTSPGEADRLDAAITAREAEAAALQAANPKPVLWRKIETAGFGVGRNVRFGDLDGDGDIDVLIAQQRHHGPRDTNSEVGCLTALTFEGERLWQVGEPDGWNDHLTNDVAVQVHDLDGDGSIEVVYCAGMELIVADGATGKVERKVPTPELPEGTRKPYDKFPRALGDALFFCDLRGAGRDSDVILKNRYEYVWAFNEKLERLWMGRSVTGHYPFAYDVDGDGRDELMAGYTLFDDDGSVLWTVSDRIKDHADGVAIVRFKPDAEPRLLCAASDEGLFFADMKGKILDHHRLGHVQNPAIADFRPDLPGLESVAINFWGNQGIVHFFDAEGAIYHDFEPQQYGSMCLPINWTGRPGEFFVLSADVTEGGMFDGWGRRAVRFPADGHPDMCNAVLDLTGDGRDEVVVWDPYEMWVYTQDDNPKPGDLHVPKRNPLYNESNYKTSVSIPAGSP